MRRMGFVRFRGPAGPRCRPEVGVPSRPRASTRAAVRGFAALPGRGAGRRSAFQAVPALLLGRRCAVSRPCRAAVPAGGRRSKPSPRFCSGGGTRFRGPVGPRRRPEVGVPSRPRAFSRSAVLWSARYAGLCRSEDRRSLPSGTIEPSSFPRTAAVSGRGADRRSAAPDRRHPDGWRTRGTCIYTAIGPGVLATEAQR